MSEMTPEQFKAYQENPDRCPFCDGEACLEAGFPDPDGLMVWQVVNCEDCGSAWTDVFHLMRATNVRKGEATHE